MSFCVYFGGFNFEENQTAFTLETQLFFAFPLFFEVLRQRGVKIFFNKRISPCNFFSLNPIFSNSSEDFARRN